MPTYTYSCDGCGEFDVFQSIHDDRFKKCPKCKSSKIKRLIGKTTFFLKGDQWPSKVMKQNDFERIDKALEKEDNKLLSQGRTVYPEGHPLAGCMI